MDSSVLIDGRIFDILKSGFLEGDFIIPLFILEEIQTLADSRDHIKRQKGKRGLDTAKRVRELTSAEIWNKKIEEVDTCKDVDTKLVILCKNLGAKMLTLDHSQNELAKIHSVPVLNVHELYLAVKPKFIVGEEIFVKIKEKGNEQDQGRGDYEGTIVIVDGGEAHLGKRIKVVIRNIMSTDAGTLIFAKPVKREEDGGIQDRGRSVAEHPRAEYSPTSTTDHNQDQ